MATSQEGLREASEIPDAPWFLAPVPVFMAMQLGPLLLWLFTPESVFRRALGGADRAPVTFAGLLAYGLMVAAFAAGSWMGMHAKLGPRTPWTERTRQALCAAHYGAIAVMLFSTASVVWIVATSGLDIRVIILASQANRFKEAVYSTGVGTQALIMGRHLLLAALITWFALGTYGSPRPRTVLLIALSAAILFLFTSSRLSVESILLVSLLFGFGRRATARGKGSQLRKLLPIGVLLLLFLVFAGGVWLRSIATWAGSTSSPLDVALGPVYEALAYVISPVNYSMAFVSRGVAFVRGLGLHNFFAVAYSVLNIPVDESYRKLISWSYSPALNQIGLVGEWFTIAGPLLWIPAAVYGLLAGATYKRFRHGRIVGVLLYPMILVALGDSMRGFLLSQNVVAANVLYLLIALVAISFARLPYTTATKPVDAA